MKTKRILALSVVSIVFSLLIFNVMSSFNFAYADNSQTFPQWFKDKTNLWTAGSLSDYEFVQAIHDLLASGFSPSTTNANQTTASMNISTETGTSAMTVDNEPRSSIAVQSKDCDDMNFPKVDWSGCNHSGAYLDHADLSGANLEGADLSYANLKDADMVGTNLKNANLDHADLEGAVMTNADLTGASLVSAHGSYVNLNWATVNNANFTNANMPISQFRWGTGTGVVFKDANLNSALFYTNDLSNADFEGADLTYAAFNMNANLTNANFDGAELHSADLGTSYITGASLHCKNNPICN